MKTKLRLLAIGFLVSCGSIFAQGQTTYWSEASPQTVRPLSSDAKAAPKKYRRLQFDFAKLEGMLAQSRTQQDEMALLFHVPLPDGRSEQFLIHRSNVMSPALAAKFPEIKTFSGHSPDHPSTSIKLDISPRGFHAMVTKPGESPVFIDPEKLGETIYYMSYYKKDYESLVQRQQYCSSDEIPENEVQRQVLEARKNKSHLFSSQDRKLRTYRIAIATTYEYSRYHGGTVSSTLAAVVTTLNRVNSIYEKDLAIHLELVENNDKIIFVTSDDPYNNNSGGTMLRQNQNTIDSKIGRSNYDIGHVFSTGGGGVAGLGVVCGSNKAWGVTGRNAPIGDPFDIDYVAHEMGHQFGANHTFNNSCSGNRAGSAAYEPGSGVTVMGYAGICSPNVANNSDAMFHAYSIEEINNFVTSSGSCATTTTLPEDIPQVDAGASYSIPKGTPFTLTGTVSGNSEGFTYSWEQFDREIATMPPSSSNTTGPAFRTFLPTSSPQRTFPNLESILKNESPKWEVLANTGRKYNFRFIVRTNGANGGLTGSDNTSIQVTANAGPFLVTYPNTSSTWNAGSTETITWDVASTNQSPISCSQIDLLLSTDGGLTYPITLASNVANDGSHDITVPNVSTDDARIKVQAVGNVFFDISNTDFSIQGGGSNTAPVFTSEPVTSTDAGEAYSYTVSASDADGDPLSYRAEEIPEWLSFDRESLLLYGTAPQSGGSYAVTLSVSDGTETVRQSFEIEVISTNDCNGSPFPYAEVYVTNVSAPLAKDGTITFTFPDVEERKVLRFSIDGGKTYPFKSGDAKGSFIIRNRAAKTFDLWIRWGNKDCPVDLGTVTLYVGDPSYARFGNTEEIRTSGDELKLYPNPVSGLLYLQGREISENTPFQIYDAQGRRIAIGKGRRLDTSTFQSGIYFIKTPSGSARFIKK